MLRSQLNAYGPDELMAHIRPGGHYGALEPWHSEGAWIRSTRSSRSPMGQKAMFQKTFHPRQLCHLGLHGWLSFHAMQPLSIGPASPKHVSPSRRPAPSKPPPPPIKRAWWDSAASRAASLLMHTHSCDAGSLSRFPDSSHSPFAASCPYRQRAFRIATPGPDREWLSCFSYGDGLHVEHSEPSAAALARSEANARITAFASMRCNWIFDVQQAAGELAPFYLPLELWPYKRRDKQRREVANRACNS